MDATGAETAELVNVANGSLTIPTLTASVVAESFPIGYWGFTASSETGRLALDSSKYYPMTVASSSTLIKKVTEAATDDTTTATFATYVDTTTAAGTYENTIVFTAVANVQPEFFTISTMQEMTTEICAAATTPTSSATTLDMDGTHEGDTSYVPSTTLTDTRDNSSYTVRKLADGNCWMTENLALGTTDEAGLTLTAEDSDVESDWVLPAYDNGKSWSNTDSTAHAVKGSTTASSSWTEGMGNWYTYNAATAGTGTELTSGAASNSICPKGWQLPIGGDSSGWQSTTSKSFGYLLKTYGGYHSMLGTMTSAPLSFMYSGYYSYQYGKWEIGEIGTSGRYWSNTANSEDDASALYTSASGIDPKISIERGNALTVRCVAK